MPDSRFVLCEPFRFQGNLSDEEWKEKSGLIRQYQKIVRKLAEEWHAPFIPLQKEFESLSVFFEILSKSIVRTFVPLVP